MGSCAAPSAKGDDKFITTDYLQQCHFDDYLLPAEVRRTQARAGPALAISEQRPVLEERLQLLDEQLATVTRTARTTSCPMPSSPSQG
uniref:hypothetical protein n=1 Tax=Escherichia coli TaxID=562 RepID=UPI001BEFC2EF|nr:hypothetical protein [Escherichia coli]QUN01903.1 DNA replication protein [Escherichia coli]